MSVFHDARHVAENELAFAVLDKYPVRRGHTLVCTKREVASLFDTTPEEIAHVLVLLKQVKQALDLTHAPLGYSIMINEGTAQHIPHLHVHLIPYYDAQPNSGVS